MKIEFKKLPPIKIAIIVASIFTLIFNRLEYQAMHNGNSLAPHILAKGSFCLLMLLYGVDCFVYQKQMLLGCFLWLVSGLLIFQMVERIIIAGGI